MTVEKHHHTCAVGGGSFFLFGEHWGSDLDPRVCVSSTLSTELLPGLGVLTF